ncbi:MAG TPA: helix-turn-helix domain-containing protein [Firmicutes bacterium]|nr:helix-turn-helix domain-containing protein [Bacillota bacterium]HHY99094.1 helix-turn-helix domain-containing protein [Bacillota bacterium]
MEALLTTQEVANILKVTVRTVYSLLESGELQGVKIGRVWRVREEDLQAFLSRPALKGEEQT